MVSEIFTKTGIYSHNEENLFSKKYPIAFKFDKYAKFGEHS